LELPRIYLLNAQTSPRPHLSPLGPQSRIAASFTLGLHSSSRTQMKDDSTTALLGYHTRGTFRSAEPRSHSISMPSRLATLVSLSCEHAFAPSVEMPNIAGWNDIAWSAIHIPTDSLHCSSEPQRACSHTTSQSRTYRVYAWHTVYRYVSRFFPQHHVVPAYSHFHAEIARLFA
jgi:hypothetical protein